MDFVNRKVQNQRSNAGCLKIGGSCCGSVDHRLSEALNLHEFTCDFLDFILANQKSR
jgi:hypothetical protein